MIEKIYTIPVNEAFDKKEGCPFCGLYHRLEDNELDIILGPSMMEPDIRIKTNKSGFCSPHLDMMFNMKNRLGLALMLESHLGENIKSALAGGLMSKLLPGGLKSEATKFNAQNHSCYVCERIGASFEKMIECAVLLWEKEHDFKEKLNAQEYFCLPHYVKYIETAAYMLSKKEQSEFFQAVKKVMTGYCEKLYGDVSWFVKKFDYRYENEPWGNSKDAVERAITFLRGNDLHG